MDKKTVLPANMEELLELVKSRADDSNSKDELLALMVASSFDSDGNICDELIYHMIGFIKNDPGAKINEIFDHLIEILPGVEYVDDGDADEVPA